MCLEKCPHPQPFPPVLGQGSQSDVSDPSPCSGAGPGWGLPAALLLALASSATLLACSGGDAFTTQRVKHDSGVDTEVPDGSDQPDSSEPDAGQDASEDTSSEAGPDAKDAAQEPFCNLKATPEDDPCVVSDATGVFLSPKGDPSPDHCGTRNNPCRKLAGLWPTALSQNKKRIYVCDDGTGFDEEVYITALANGFEVYGGFHCTDWSYDPTSYRAVFRTPAPDKPWFIEGVDGGVTFDAIEVRAGNATAPSGSSIAVVIVDSTNVVFHRSVIAAGAAAPGQPGADGAAGTSGPQIGAPQAGASANCVNPPATQDGGGWATGNACGSKGGRGGFSQTNHAGNEGSDGEPYALPNHGSGGTGMDDGGDGFVGQAGVDAVNGSEAAEMGTFGYGFTYFTPANGADGENGTPGQGGGGGGSSAGTAACAGASGGAGGMGGCGGVGGKGGKGGGASIGLMLFNSFVTVDDTAVRAGLGGAGGNGGNGGNGGKGSPGAPGGGGVVSVVGNGGKGGPGGPGGHGGCGSGGSGGPSIGIAYKGIAPNIKNSDVTFDVAGGKGFGGSLCTTPAPDGYTGKSLNILSIQDP